MEIVFNNRKTALNMGQFWYSLKRCKYVLYILKSIEVREWLKSYLYSIEIYF